MRVAFLGTGQWGLCFLKLLVATTSVVGVVTQPGNTGLAAAARTGRIDLCTVTRTKGREYGSFLRKLSVDLIVSAGFPLILPIRILRLPGLGAINIHGSYLPAYRGPQPVEWQIINGELHSGVTIHRMDRGHRHRRNTRSGLRLLKFGNRYAAHGYDETLPNRRTFA